MTKPKPKRGGRPVGAKLDKKTGLTPNQMDIAHSMLDIELESGIWPASVAQIARATGRNVKTVRAVLKKKEFVTYLSQLLDAEGVVLEGAFWRSMALGLSVGDTKTMDLYARMTGKIASKESKGPKIEILIKGPDGETIPAYEVIEGEVVSEGDDDDDKPLPLSASNDS